MKSSSRAAVEKIESYRDLIVWQKAMSLAKQVYVVTNGFPKGEVFGLTQQVRRAAVSVPSNIAEGNGRGSMQDYLRFLYISRGSLFETQTQIELARDLGFLPSDEAQSLFSLTNELERMLNRLITKFSS